MCVKIKFRFSELLSRSGGDIFIDSDEETTTAEAIDKLLCYFQSVSFCYNYGSVSCEILSVDDLEELVMSRFDCLAKHNAKLSLVVLYVWVCNLLESEDVYLAHVEAAAFNVFVIIKSGLSKEDNAFLVLTVAALQEAFSAIQFCNLFADCLIKQEE